MTPCPYLSVRGTCFALLCHGADVIAHPRCPARRDDGWHAELLRGPVVGAPRGEQGQEPAPAPSVIKDVYERYKHLDALLCDREWIGDGAQRQCLYDLWQAIRAVGQPGKDVDE